VSLYTSACILLYALSACFVLTFSHPHYATGSFLLKALVPNALYTIAYTTQRAGEGGMRFAFSG